MQISANISNGIATMESKQFSQLMDTIISLQTELKTGFPFTTFPKQLELLANNEATYDQALLDTKKLAAYTGQTCKLVFNNKPHYVSPTGDVSAPWDSTQR